MPGKFCSEIVLFQNCTPGRVAQRRHETGTSKQFDHSFSQFSRIPEITQKTVLPMPDDFAYRRRIRTHKKTAAAHGFKQAG